jgi:hypothetical protein
MLRWTIPFLFAVAASGPADAADQAPARHVPHHAANRLPAGLPRPHYKFRTTITYGPPAAPPPVFYDGPDVPSLPYIPPLIGAPLLPGSATLPGYYGSSYSYDYQGPYYGGPYVGYWDRLPYACGVYGYC